MEIKIDDSRKIAAVQEEFNEMFPYLKIEFFSKPHKVEKPSSKKMLKHPDRTIGQCRSIHTQGGLAIIPSMTVTELEQRFNDEYGLSVQVFRKSGRVWLETTVTDSWTLEEQNQQGLELSDRQQIYKEAIDENKLTE